MYKILELELLLCKKCNKEYSEENKPCILSCGKTICSECSVKLTKTSISDGVILEKCFFDQGHSHAGENSPVNFSFLDIVTGLKVNLEKRKKPKEDIFISHLHNSTIPSNFKSSSLGYNGSLEDGKKHGQGKLITSIYIYEGNFQNDLPIGPGKLIHKTKGVFEGTFTGEYGNGRGIILYSNGDTYSGEWKNMNKKGKGTLRLHNGNKYEGNFANDLYDGYGEFINIEENKTIKGHWKEGKENGDFMIYTNKESKPVKALYKAGVLVKVYDN